MAEIAISPQPFSLRILASSRRFIRWLTSAKVVLALIMLAIMFVMVVVSLYQLLATTLVWGPADLPQHPEAVKGEFTVYHWVRMFTGRLGQIYTFAPLRHSMTVAIGATLLALSIGGALAWLTSFRSGAGRSSSINRPSTQPAR